jgi:hypothetical protein
MTQIWPEKFAGQQAADCFLIANLGWGKSFQLCVWRGALCFALRASASCATDKDNNSAGDTLPSGQVI